MAQRDRRGSVGAALLSSGSTWLSRVRSGLVGRSLAQLKKAPACSKEGLSSISGSATQ